jgi:hypoxanthine-DNA glycosylase
LGGWNIKGRNSFTQIEIDRLRRLIKEKVVATPGVQKGIRGKIRRIGFYYSDFSNKKGYTVEDFDGLIRSGQIKIIGNPEVIYSANHDKYRKNQPSPHTSHTRKRKKPVIVNSVNKLLNPNFGLDAVIDENVRFLICGTFPAKESIGAGFYYQNQIKRFWGQALQGVDDLESLDNNTRESRLLKKNIGLWDIFESIERAVGNKDTAIKKAKYNAFENLLNEYSSIEYLVFNSKNAYDWFCEDHPSIVGSKTPKIVRLQSSSGSNGWFKQGEDWATFFKSVGFKGS